MRRFIKFAAPLAAVSALGLGLSACSSGSNSAAPTTTTSAPASSGPASGGGQVGDAPSNAAPPGSPSAAAYTPTGSIVANDGFDPAQNGYGFANYGTNGPDGTSTVTNMNPQSMQTLFGNSVCADPSASTCSLTPEAKAWMDQVNNSSGGGHCYGFSVSSLLFWKGTIKPSDFGASSTPQLTFNGNNALQSQIATNFAFQFLPWVKSQWLTGTPTQVLNSLKQALSPDNPETYTLVIFKKDGTGGHAITPYGIEDNGNGLFHILVYDNNWPGVTRAVTVDTNANTWSYDASINPNEAAEHYDGDSNTKSLILAPTTPGVSSQSFPNGNTNASNASSGATGTAGTFQLAAFSAQNSPSNPTLDQIYLDGSDTNHSHLLITNSAGQKVGYDGGQLVNTIPGAQIEHTASTQNWNESLEPTYYVPDGSMYTISVNGSTLTQADPGEDVGFIAPNYDLEVDNLNVSPGEHDTITVSPDDSNVTFSSTKSEAPHFVFGLSTSAADFSLDIKAAADGANGSYHMGLASDGKSMTLDTGQSAGTYGFDLERDDASTGNVNNFTHSGISLGAGDNIKINYGSWDSTTASIPLSITQGGSTHTEQLSDQDTSNAPTPDPSASDNGGA